MENYGKRICLRYEQSLLEEDNDNITNLAIIDDNGNVLFNENFNGKHLLKDSIGEINRIVQGAECIIDYHRNTYLLQRNGVNFKGIKKVDFAYDFAVMYGNWHSLNKSFVCQPLAVCAKWFGFNFNFDNSALENVKIMLSCYQQVQKDIVRNNGYIIFDTCKNVPGMPTVIAYNRNAPESFAVWTQTGKNDFYGGKYFIDYDKAMSYFLSDVRNKCYKIGKYSQNHTLHIINKFDSDKEIAQIDRTGDINFLENLPIHIQEEIEDIADKVKSRYSEFKEISAKELDVLAQSDIPFETSKQQDGFIIKYNKVYSSQVNQILTQINCRR